jgi:hypothetical protein
MKECVCGYTRYTLSKMKFILRNSHRARYYYLSLHYVYVVRIVTQ